MSIAERPGGGVVPAGRRSQRARRMPRASMDIRLPWPLGRTILLVALLAAVCFGAGTAVLGDTRYHGELSLLVLKLNDPHPRKGIEIVDRRITAITAIARSENFLTELQRETGVDVGVEELASMIDATRPNFGAIALITVDGDEREVVEALTRHLPTAMSTVVDRVRSGSGDLTAGNGLNLATGDDPDYRGPLYLELFTDLSAGQTTTVAVTEPRVLVNAFMGALLAAMVMAVVGALAHERQRVTTSEDLEELLEVEQLASVPRPSRARRSGSARLLMGLANELASIANEDRFAVGFAGVGTRRLRRRFVRCMATTTAAVTGEPVVVVDLDTGGGPLGRWSRPVAGLLDQPVDADVPPSLRPMRRWSLPGWARRLGRDIPVLEVHLGQTTDQSVDADARLAEAVAALTVDHVVLVNLPTTPGPVAVGSTIGALDVSVLLLLDGWTPLDDARVVADALFAGAAGPVGSVVIAN